jgi:hypothetical protein
MCFTNVLNSVPVPLSRLHQHPVQLLLGLGVAQLLGSAVAATSHCYFSLADIKRYKDTIFSSLSH